MLKINNVTYEALPIESIHNFAEKLINEYKNQKNDIIGIINGIELRVTPYENQMSLYWQYKYKLELMKTTL